MVLSQDYSHLKINEIMACNTFTCLNTEYSDFDDWIEIYNSGSQAIDLSGLYLTDDLQTPFKWQIPHGQVIRPHDFFIFWADGFGEGNRTNFKLSQKGESIGLFRDDGIVIDSLTFGVQISDISFGRYPDGGPTRMYFSESTFNQPNKLGVRKAQRTPDPVFSVSGGLYTAPQSVFLTASNHARIFYTVDGSFPSNQSSEYTDAILINQSAVIRARAYEDSLLPSNIITQTYIIHKTSSLPVIAISTDPDFLFDNDIGISVGECVDNAVGADPPFDPEANFWKDWERPAHFEFYEVNGKKGFSLNAGIAIFGGAFGRQIPQKSFSIFARDKYDDEEIFYPLFQSKSINKFKRLVLRTSSNDFNRTFFRDAMMTTVVASKMDVDYQAYRPAIGFINGQYWGIYNIREKMNEFYPESNYGIDADDVDLIENGGEVANGSDDLYNALINFVKSNDLTIASNYQCVKSQMDIDEFMNYFIAELYFRNHDWIVRNIKCWRKHTNDGKWRWLLYDLDWGFGGESREGDRQYETNSIQWALNWGEPSLLLQKFFENNEFKNEFIQRFASHLSITFHPDRVLRIIDSLKTQIEAEMPSHINRWDIPQDMVAWDNEIQILRDFAVNRSHFVREHLTSVFNLSGRVNFLVRVSDINRGIINIANVDIPYNDFEGRYFTDVPIQLVAKPKAGYRFLQWSGVSNASTDTISVILKSDSEIVAHFEHSNLPAIVINEIHYNPSDNLQGDDDNYEFVEIYNPTGNDIDVSGYWFQSGINFTFSSGTFIQSGEYVILAKNEAIYKDKGCQVFQYNKNLSNSGETIALYDNKNNMIDSVRYLDKYPWPISADGDGSSLELSDPNMDNSVATNWRASSVIGGSPGMRNNKTFIRNNDPEPLTFQVDHAYPNPFNSQVIVPISITQQSDVILTIYNLLGQEIHTISNLDLTPGNHFLKWNGKDNLGRDLNAGVYVYKLLIQDRLFMGKMTLIR